LVNSNYAITARKSYYPYLEMDEFWAYMENKSKKYWLIYAYERQSGEIVAYVWGKQDLKTAKGLRERLFKLGVSFGCICRG
jgi:IS1 family transposase